MSKNQETTHHSTKVDDLLDLDIDTIYWHGVILAMWPRYIEQPFYLPTHGYFTRTLSFRTFTSGKGLPLMSKEIYTRLTFIQTAWRSLNCDPFSDQGSE